MNRVVRNFATGALALLGVAFGLARAAGAGEPGPRANLAGKIDLAPLRTLTVQDGGRRKPFDTLAREKVKFVLGTERYGGEDPVYTFLSLLFEPERWVDLRAVKVDNLGLRKLLGAGGKFVSFGEIRDSAAFRECVEEAQARAGMTGPNENAALELHHRTLVFANLARLVRVAPVAGSGEGAAWASLGDLSALSDGAREDVRRLVAAAAQAFRASDGPAATEALRALASRLAALQGPDALPAWKAHLEVALNKIHPFRISWMALAAAALLLGFAAVTGARWLRSAGLAALFAGALLGFFGVAARAAIVERAPVANLYEATIFFVFVAVLFGVVFEVWRRSGLFGMAASLFGFLAFLLVDLAPGMDPTIGPIQPVLRSYWLNIHVTAMLASYGAFAVAFVLGVFYYAKYLPAKGLPRTAILLPALVALSGLGGLFYRAVSEERPALADYAVALVGAPVAAIAAGWAWLALSGASEKKVEYQDELALKTIERHLYRVCQIGFVLITAGIILGAVWANESWGRYWGWDPKETWAFITWLVYGVFIHGRIAGWFRGPRAAIWAIVGFYSVLFTFFGVSFVLPGLHSYLNPGQ